MQRILILGSGGAGKSTLAHRLSTVLGIEIIHLDTLFWKPGWVETEQEEWKAKVRAVVQRESWIMDGDFSGTLAERLKVCDTVIFLDLPRAVCVWRILKRLIRYHGRSRPDLPLGCPERFDADFMAWVWSYTARTRPRVLAFLRAGGHSIEHGTYADAESATLFKRNGGYLIPALLAGDFVVREAAKPNSFLSPAEQAKALEAGHRMVDMLRGMHAAGVKIAFGTDTGVSAHGDNALELALMVKAGMTPLETIQAATINAADHVSLTAEIGSIAPGKSADIIAVNGDPLSNVRELESGDFVMAKGKVYKQ